MEISTVDATRIIFTSTACLATFLNITIIFATIWRTKELTSTSLITFWLCCFDGLVASVDFTINVSTLTLHHVIDSTTFQTHTLSSTICQIHGLLHIFGGSSSLLLCLLLTTFRYSVIIQKHILSRKRTITYIALAITAAATFAGLPFILHAPEIYILHPSQEYCATDWSQQGPKPRVVVFINIMTVIPPVSFIGYAYYKMYQNVSKQCRKASEVVRNARLHAEMKGRTGSDTEFESSYVSQNNQGTSSETVVNVPEYSRGLEKEAEEEERRLLKQSVIIVSAFLIGWSPYLLVMVYEATTTTLVPPIYDFLAIFCTVLNQAINPMIVITYNSEIRNNLIFWK
ncbi:family A G protein-coupled receptor-like protein [Rhizoclosmatium globosum]|uniref:Family A G protein-coupled receptor-like protein n=1 Tax=Rhizoclosmatium globosum TaxID=329046 RepID=A0A1Y2BDA3_9FUNG|nr:family A G protein-coupled receptor-like protein [Rhizoclosmatium globosum]|eukprot:ORY32467.1 family A G protein-coupled receptor-like protein [Rhizoclosmatium globosum]